MPYEKDWSVWKPDITTQTIWKSNIIKRNQWLDLIIFSNQMKSSPQKLWIRSSNYAIWYVIVDINTYLFCHKGKSIIWPLLPHHTARLVFNGIAGHDKLLFHSHCWSNSALVAVLPLLNNCKSRVWHTMYIFFKFCKKQKRIIVHLVHRNKE